MTGLQMLNVRFWCLHILVLTMVLAGMSAPTYAEKGDRLVPANPLGANSNWQTDVDKNKPKEAPAAPVAPVAPAAPQTPAAAPAEAPAPAAPKIPDTAAAQPSTTAQPEDIQALNDYFNNLTNLEGRFTQTDSGNNQTKGAFYMKRPGRIRFDYDSPSNLRIVSDGKWLSIEDRDLSTYDRYPLESTPFRMLLKKEVNLNEDADIIDFFKGDDLIIVTLSDKVEKDAGRIKLFFSRNELQLKEWITTDQQGLDTRVQLSEIVVGKKIEPGFFVVTDDTLSVFSNR